VSAQLNTLFRNYSKSGKTAPLKEFAQKTLPTLEHHLSMVRELNRPAGVAGKQPSTSGGQAIGPSAGRDLRK